MAKLKIWDVNWAAQTAGPSPDMNKRTELFLLGCKKAMDGNPCKGCFQKALWDEKKAIYFHPVEETISKLSKFSPNKYVTIGGGEPSDQLEGLIELTRGLKKQGFHIIVYTWHSLIDILSEKEYELSLKKKQYLDFLNNIDILIDGQFKQEQCNYIHDYSDGLLGSIGSGNQIIWDIKEYQKNKKHVLGYKLEDLVHITLRENNDDLIYITKEKCVPEKISII